MTNEPQAIEAYETLLARARKIIGSAPYFSSAHDDFAQLKIDGGEAVLSWPEVHSGYYDSTSIEEQSISFPADLLSMSDDDLMIWQAEKRRIYEEAKLANRQRSIQQQRNQEMAQLAALKRKYESSCLSGCRTQMTKATRC